MASLGRLSATVAHELNNPLEGILTYAKLNARRLQKVQEPAVAPIREDFELIIREIQRCGNIVKNLLLFSRKQVGEFGVAPVADIVEQAARLVRHHFGISGVSYHQVRFQEAVGTPGNPSLEWFSIRTLGLRDTTRLRGSSPPRSDSPPVRLCNSDSGKRVTVAADADPTRSAKSLFNSFRVDIICDSAFPGFAPRAELFHPCGVASHGLLLWIEHNHIPLGSPGPGSDDPERIE